MEMYILRAPYSGKGLRGDEVKKAISMAITLLMLVSGFVVMVEESSGYENNTGASSTPSPVSRLISHAPIHIDSDSDFSNQAANEGWKGSGTEDDPYIIENYEINMSSYARYYGPCIYIGNTTVYFVVRNCNIYSTYFSSGLTMYRVRNGTVDSITVSNGFYGVYLAYSHSNIISNNNLSNNIEGIRLENSDGNIILNNSIYKDHEGINLLDSSNNRLYNNTMVGNSIFIKGDKLRHWNTQNIDISNTVNGKPVYYWKNRIGGTVPTGSGEVILANCTHVVVEYQKLYNISVGLEIGFSYRNIISNNEVNSNRFWGVYLYSSNNNFISNNILNRNTEYGIYLVHSYKNLISNNNLSKNYYAINIYYSENNIVSNNSFFHNGCGINIKGFNNKISNNSIYKNGCGISFQFDNKIYHNNFIDNLKQAFGNGSLNVTYPTGGNYWSDYNGPDEHSGADQKGPGSDGIGDTPYINIEGGAGAKDNYPLMAPVKLDTIHPVVSIAFPLDNSIFNESSLTITWSGSDNVGIKHYEIRIDNGSWIDIGKNTSYKLNNLNNGNHTVFVKAVDKSGNERISHVSFKVNAVSNGGNGGLGEGNNPSNGSFLWIFILLVLVLVGVLTAIFMKRKSRKESEETETSENEDDIDY